MNQDTISAASAALDALESAGSPMMGNLLLDAVWGTDIFSIAICVLILLGSIFSVAVMIERYRYFRKATGKTLEILDTLQSDHNAVDAYLRLTGGNHAKRYQPDNPGMYLLSECYTEAWDTAREQAGKRHVTHETIEAVDRVRGRALTEIQVKLEQHLVFLAIMANVAPLMGLLGTVWGVLSVFHGLSGSSGTVGMDAIAPGIQGALVTTVVGLIAAIPAAVAYNILNNRANEILLSLESVGMRFCASLARYLPQ